MVDVSKMRNSYVHPPLLESTAPRDPHAFFERWLEEAKHLLEANAMTLCTVDASGQPQARIVLLRGHDSRGFTFFTNYDSDKGHELRVHPHASLNFFWRELARQVRVSGVAMRVSAEESDAYFASRPRGHQLGAWASAQSREIAAREIVDAEMKRLQVQYPGVVPRPPHWGGYRLVPQRLEFWQGQENRLHDRLVYELDGGVWSRVRLSP